VLAGFIAEKDVCHILVIFHSLMLFRVVVLPPGSRCLAYEAVSFGETSRRFKEVNRKIQGVSVEIYKLNFAVWSKERHTYCETSCSRRHGERSGKDVLD